MKKIHYKEDFPLLISMPNPCGVPTGVPDFDFTVRLISGMTEYMAGRRDGVLYNCRQESDDRLCVYVDNHGLMPCAELGCEIIYDIPDRSMPDGIRRVVKKYPTGLSLSDAAACICRAEFEALLPYIKGEDGEHGRDGSDAGISVIGFLEFVTDCNTYRVPVLKIPDIGPTDYYYYYSSGYIRIGDWDIDLESLMDESEVEPLNDIEDEDNSLL